MTARLRSPVSRLRWPARKALASGAVAAVLALLATGVTASADTTGWNSGALCTSNSPGTSSSPDACDTMHDGGGHGIDVHTSQGNMQAICVYDYAGNPSSCEQTAGAAYNGFGRTASGTNDGDTLDAYGNSNVFVPTTRIMSDSGTGILTSGSYGACPAGNLVSESGCVLMSAGDITALHSMETAPSWTLLTLANGWRERGSGFPPLAVREVATPPGTVQFEGQVSGGAWRWGEQIAAVPSGDVPAAEQVIPASCGGAAYCEITVEPDGAVKVWGQQPSSLIQVGSASYALGQ